MLCIRSLSYHLRHTPWLDYPMENSYKIILYEMVLIPFNSESWLQKIDVFQLSESSLNFDENEHLG